MIILPRGTRMTLVLAAVADILVFSTASPLTIFLAGIGAAMIAIGINYSFKPSSFIGLSMLAVTAALGMEIPSLTDISTLVVAIVGLLLPVFFLAMLALASEEPEHRMPIMRRPLLLSLGFAMLCVWAVPIVSILVSLFAPTLSVRLTPMTEAAVVLLAAIAGGVLLTYRTARTSSPQVAMSVSEKD